MQGVKPPADSVTTRILRRIEHRLTAIDGTGAFINDLAGRVFMRRPTFDADSEPFPSVFVRVRQFTREFRPEETFTDVVMVLDVFGIVANEDNSTFAGAELLADLYRALEIDGDRFLKCPTTGRDLLGAELQIVDVQLQDIQAPATFDLVGVGVSCPYPQKYGDPNHVT
jgi:hypothetical protein